VDPDSKHLPPAVPRGAGAGGPSAGGALHVFVSDGLGRPVRDGGLSRWLARAAPPRARGEVAIALVTDARVRTLNQQYRRKNSPTDVLSFPDRSPGLPRDGTRIPDTALRRAQGVPSLSRAASRQQRSSHLGDIVIATGVARRQAREAGHSYATELRVLALHGLLHLLGYDHDSPHDAGRMARAEARLRRKSGLTAGLIERTGSMTGTAAAGGVRRRRKAAQ
jgi:probable rRNA maturation factor